MHQNSSSAPEINEFFASRLPFQLPIGQFVHANRFDGWSGSGRPSAADCTHVCGAYLDCDLGKGFETLEEIHTWLDGLPMRPTCRIETGGGVHSWYLLGDEEGDGDLAESPELRDLPARFVAWAQTLVPELDPVGDLARLLRMPGTTNTKRTPAQAVAIVGEPGPRYVPSDFDWLPALPETAPARRPVSPRAGSSVQDPPQGLPGDSVDPGAARGALRVLTSSEPALGALLEREAAATALYDDDWSRIDLAVASRVHGALRRCGYVAEDAVELASWAWRDSRRRHPEPNGNHPDKPDRADEVRRIAEKLTRDGPVQDLNGSPSVPASGMEDHIASASAIVGARIVRIVRVHGVGCYVIEFEDGKTITVPHLSVESQGRSAFQTAASQAGVVTTKFRVPKNGPDPWEVAAQHMMRAAVTSEDGEASFPHEIVRQALRKLILGKWTITASSAAYAENARTHPTLAQGYIHQSKKKNGPSLRFMLSDLLRALTDDGHSMTVPEVARHFKALEIRSISAAFGKARVQMWCARGEFLELALEKSNQAKSGDRQLQDMLDKNAGGGGGKSGLSDEDQEPGKSATDDPEDGFFEGGFGEGLL